MTVVVPVELLPLGPFAERVWQLRATVSTCDAWYVGEFLAVRRRAADP